MTDRNTLRTGVLVVTLALAGACSDDDPSPSATTSGTSSSEAESTGTLDLGDERAERCEDVRGMDARALGVEPGAPASVAASFAREVLDWPDATVSSGASECSLVIRSATHHRQVQLRLASTTTGTAQVLSASSYADVADPPVLGVGFRGQEATIGSNSGCETCTRARVHVPYAGGVASTDAGLPVEANLELPSGATNRGVIVLFLNQAGTVEAVIATSVPDGDFAAG